MTTNTTVEKRGDTVYLRASFYGGRITMFPMTPDEAANLIEQLQFVLEPEPLRD